MAADTPPISKLGDDLLEEILVRSFPNPRSACRSKPVCKRWNSLISHTGFNRSFVSHHRSISEGLQPPLLLYKDDPLPSLLSFLLVPDELRSNFVVWDSFKDLLPWGFQNSVWDYNHERARSLLICNPFTKQWVALPLEPETPGYPDYRFRVLVRYEGDPVYEWGSELKVFCSESGEWSSKVVNYRLPSDATSWDGKLYWIKYGSEIERFDAFHPNKKPITIRNMEFVGRQHLFSQLSGSRGALYIVEHHRPDYGEADDDDVFVVWRWEGGRKTWILCYQVSLEKLKRNGGGPEVEELEIVSVLAQHSEQPEILFLECYCKPANFKETEILFYCWGEPFFKDIKETLVFTCNLRTEKLELVADQRQCTFLCCWLVLQPWTTCFSTSIPSYEKLLGMYNESCSDLIQSRQST
ncbi:unnamed protein product [Linum trigynum]|uniref:F-box domain-containing protein n=1 Tax=Linum trigynum TaxID=586398 RepID=A0AAV2D7C5_9ROSI